LCAIVTNKKKLFLVVWYNF